MRITRKEYQSLFDSRLRARREAISFSTPLHVFFLKKKTGGAIKVSCKKSVGKAVARNQLKRQLRLVLKDFDQLKDFFVLGVIKNSHSLQKSQEADMISKVMERKIGKIL